mgnify:CR=1 FL=1
MLKHWLPRLGLAFSLITVGAAAQAESLSIAATPVPHAELLEFIQEDLQEQGIDLDIKVFTDYVQPNQQVAEGQIDANFFQHKPYLDSFNQERGTDLVSLGVIHVEPFGAYSQKIDAISDLKPGALVAIPNDPSNGARALLLLQKQGLIELKDPTNVLATSRDISSNPHKLKFKELEAAALPRVLPDVDLALINTNYALEAGLNPLEDALFIEGDESPYANLVAVSASQKDDPRFAILMETLQSPKVRQFIIDTYQGAIVPAF